jgi:hypothetical protein
MFKRTRKRARWVGLGFAVDALLVALAAKREMTAASTRQAGGES